MKELLDCYLPVFKQIISMTSNLETCTEYGLSRQSCIEQLELAMNHAGELDTSEDDKEAAHLAVVAWLDETILCSGLPWRQNWQSELLQRKYLDTTIAGERFFTRLEQLDPACEQARKVFLFCLQNGFHGRYSRPEDVPALQEIISAQRQLCLPGAWLNWPNDAAITPPVIRQPALQLLTKRPLLNVTVGVALLYGALFSLLHNYIT
jgi:type VI secretion system protein ImpK